MLTVRPDPSCPRFPAFPCGVHLPFLGRHEKPLSTPLCCTGRPTRGMVLTEDAPKTGFEQTARHKAQTKPSPHVHFVWLAKCFSIFEPTVKGQVISHKNPRFWLFL